MNEKNVYCGCTGNTKNYSGWQIWAKARNLDPKFAGKGFCRHCGYIPWTFKSSEEDAEFRELVGIER